MSNSGQLAFKKFIYYLVIYKIRNIVKNISLFINFLKFINIFKKFNLPINKYITNYYLINKYFNIKLKNINFKQKKDKK